ncbi:MAG: hypothetical protein ABJX32_06400 [Tateyamaria sp.]|uniref:hypothetical protein n=1 Tax=Tateyamaria sp. TaxID=1929288 RepID=UPI00329F3BE3
MTEHDSMLGMLKFSAAENRSLREVMHDNRGAQSGRQVRKTPSLFERRAKWVCDTCGRLILPTQQPVYVGSYKLCERPACEAEARRRSGALR